MKDNKDDKLDNKKRKIEFRAKATNRDENREYRTNYKNGDWVYGLITDMENYYGYAQMVNSDGVSGIDVDPDTVGQFTGLCDKSGKKIYEGDVVMFNKGRKLPNYEHCPELIKWHQGDCAFQRYPYGKSLTISNSGKLIQPDMMVECEVIGNIYDNPELLWGRDEECDN